MVVENATCQHCGCRFEWPVEKTCPNCGDKKKAVGVDDEKGWKEASKNRGWREVCGERIYFPNKWEANYYRYLMWLKGRGEIDDFEYQPKPPFDFSEWYKHGTNSYRADFRVKCGEGEYYVEVKGWMDGKSKTKLNRMRKHYPEVKLELVMGKQYRAIKKAVMGIIGDWE